MAIEHYYHLCSKNIGVAAEIRCHDGRVYRGIIDRVDRRKVYIRPLSAGPRNQGMFLWGFGPTYGQGLVIGIALGAIATIAFLPFFGW
jgi:hypothetical protein